MKNYRIDTKDNDQNGDYNIKKLQLTTPWSFKS